MLLLIAANKPILVYEIPIYIVFTILATVLAAIIAQICSHRLSVIRDNKKEFMEKYQELYTNILVPISNYMTIKTNPRKLHDVHHNVDENDLLEITINNLKENIKYASPTLLVIYERYIGYEYYDDGWGTREETDKHALVYFLLDDLLRGSKKTKVFSKTDRTRLKYLKYYYGLCAMALSFFEMDDTEIILTMENFSGTKRKIKYLNFKKTLITLDIYKMANHLLKHLNKVNDPEKGMYKDLVAHLSSYKNK